MRPTGLVLRNDHRLTRRESCLLVMAILGILLAGLLLYAGGYNESFFAEDARVRGVFEALTELGSDKLYLVVLCLVYVSYDKRFGRRLCYVFFLTVYATDFLKEFFHDPRPPANLLRESPTSGYGFPSGHTTTSVSFYGYPLLSHLDEPRVRTLLALVCGFVMVVVPVSRLVIGAHDVQDVVGAVVITLFLLVAYMRVHPVVSRWASTWSLGVRVAVGSTAALLLWVVGGLVLAARHPGETAVVLEQTAMGGGLLLGCAIAFPLEQAYFDYRPELLSWRNRALAAVIGFPVTVAAYGGMAGLSDLLLPGYVGDLIVYFVFMVVLGLIVPGILHRVLPREGSSMEPNGSQ